MICNGGIGGAVTQSGEPSIFIGCLHIYIELICSKSGGRPLKSAALK